MKNKIVLFITGCFALVLSSCIKSDEPTDVELIKNCQISSFSLSNDSVPGLSKVKFTIDQLSGRIFNIDSMPYGTKVKNVSCAVTYASSYSITGVEVSPDAFPDSTYYWNGTDSVNFSKSVRFVVHAFDGITTKVYRAELNIHQEVPDSMVWVKYGDRMVDVFIREQKVVASVYNGVDSYLMYLKPTAGNEPYQLYRTSVADPKGWERLTLTGLPSDGLSLSQLTEYNGSFYVVASNGALYTSANGLDWAAMENVPPVKYILGTVKMDVRRPSALATIVERGGTLNFYTMNKLNIWSAGGVVPSGFPVTGFGSVQYEAMYYQYLMVAAGRDKDNELLNTTWATADGLSWTVMCGAGTSGFFKREGTMLANYDNRLFMIGGFDAQGRALGDIHTSKDNGITWAAQDTLVTLPPLFGSRGFGSIIVDRQNFVNVFGGKIQLDLGDVNQLWRGRINRLVLKD